MRYRDLVLKSFLAMIITMCSPIAPGTSNALTDQAIVLECIYDANPAGRATITIDLADKTAMIEITNWQATPSQFTSHGTVTRITAQQVVWIPTEETSRSPISTIYTLNRYTLHLSVIQVGRSTGQVVGNSQYTCHKVTKQI